MANETFTPRGIISRYVDRNTIKESGLVRVRGIFVKSNEQSGSTKAFCFDKLQDEITGASLKLYCPRELRTLIKDGETVELTGSVKDYGFRENGTLQVQMNVTDCEPAKDLFVPKVENDKYRIRRQKTINGYRNVEASLCSLLRRGNTPRVALVYPGGTIVDTDFNKAIGAAKDCFSFESRYVPFSDAASVVETLKDCERKEFDLVCIVRGGGTGLQSLDNIDILTQVALMKIPVITAIGHAEDSLFIDSVADVCKETPSLLGTFFKELIVNLKRDESSQKENERLRASNRRLVLTIVVILLALLAWAAYKFFSSQPVS